MEENHVIGLGGHKDTHITLPPDKGEFGRGEEAEMVMLPGVTEMADREGGESIKIG